MSSVQFSQQAWNEYLSWQEQDKKTLSRINRLIQSVMRTPFEGEGKPEALSGDLAGMWSRRINEKDRLVYCVEGEIVTILQCKGHYSDK